MNKPLKIIMLGTYVMKKPDAECIHFSSIANGLFKQGHEVIIYHLSLKDSPAITNMLIPGIQVNEIFINAKTNNQMVIMGVFAINSLFRLIRNICPDIIYVRLGVTSGFYVLLTRLLFGNRIKIITEHNGWMAEEAFLAGKSRSIIVVNKVLQKYSSIYSNKVRAVSNGIKSYLVSLGVDENKIFIAGNGTDTGHFRSMENKPCYDIGFIGNLAKWQGIDWLIEAFAQTLKEKPGTHLAIGGSGPQEATIKKEIARLGVEKQVTMMGSVPYSNVPDFINSCRICVAPFKPRGSEFDDKSLSPLKIRDYAACGKPIIASRIPGLEEIEQNGFGLLVEPDDIMGFSNAMKKLLDNPTFCDEMGRKARSYAEKNYSWDLIAKSICREMDIISLFP